MFVRCNSNVERPSNKLLAVAAALRVANLFLAFKFKWINGGNINVGLLRQSRVCWYYDLSMCFRAVTLWIKIFELFFY